MISCPGNNDLLNLRLGTRAFWSLDHFFSSLNTSLFFSLSGCGEGV